MRRTLTPMLMALVASISVASAALAAPNPDHAGCQAILTSPDAHIGIRDDLAREFSALGIPPGEIYGAVARAKGTTGDECLEAAGL